MRHNGVLGAILVLLLVAGATAQASIVVTFDDLATPEQWTGAYGNQHYGIVPMSYDGLLWTPDGEAGWNVGNGPSYQAAYGNTYATPSGNNFGYNSGLAITQTSGGLYYFDGALFSTWALNDSFVFISSQTVTITGYRAGNLVDSYTVQLSDDSYVPGRALNGLVDTVEFASDGDNRYWLMDNMVYDPIPEPATIIIWSLLGAGSWLGMRVWRRRGSGLDDEMSGPARQPWSPESRQAIHEMIARGRSRRS
jgi:hypothetical protein